MSEIDIFKLLLTAYLLGISTVFFTAKLVSGLWMGDGQAAGCGLLLNLVLILLGTAIASVWFFSYQ